MVPLHPFTKCINGVLKSVEVHGIEPWIIYSFTDLTTKTDHLTVPFLNEKTRRSRYPGLWFQNPECLYNQIMKWFALDYYEIKYQDENRKMLYRDTVPIRWLYKKIT